MVPIRFLIDNNVPDAVSNYLRDRAHDIVLVRDELGVDNVSDPIIISTARDLHRVVVTWNYKHFVAEATSSVDRKDRRLLTWGLLTYHVPETMGLERTEATITTIEWEAGQCAATPLSGLYLFLEIHRKTTTSHR